MSFLKSLFGKLTEGNDRINVLNAADFHAQIDGKRVQLVDVRTPGEFKSGHIKKAVNVDVNDGGFKDKMEKFSMEEPIYIYCRSGARSRMAASKLVRMGFAEVKDLRGGIMSWPY